MRYLTTAAIALALAAGGVAEAQPQGQGQGPGQGQGQHHGQGGGQGVAHQGGGQPGQGGATSGGVHGQAPGAQTFQRGAGQAGAGAGQHYSGGAHTTFQSGGGAGQRGAGGASHFQGNARNPYANVQPGGGPGLQGRGTNAIPRESGFGFQNHALRDRDQGRGWFNGGAFPHAFQATRRFQAAPYVYPRGWYARTWAYGNYLPLGWYTPDYYLDWADYGLPAPPIGCEWIRVGSDALLVDIWTGEVLSVYSGLFD